MTTRRTFLITGLVAAVAGLTGCTAQVSERPRLSLGFTHLTPITLAVAGLRTESDYVAPMRAPNVDHEFPVPPAEALANWGRDRIRTVGGTTDRAVWVIEDAAACTTG